MTAAITWLDWPAPCGVKACYTLRTGGYSRSPYESFNMGLHVGDQAAAVHQNRHSLLETINESFIDAEAICWLTQTHSTKVVEASTVALNTKADASYCSKLGPSAAVMTADCLPVFFCDQEGERVAVAHAGWRGLLRGMLHQVLDYFPVKPMVMAYLGPAISAAAYKVGDDLRLAYIAEDKNYARYFQSTPKKSDWDEGVWLCDLYGIARYQLNIIGVNDIYGGDRCTFTEAAHFFSYRRDGVTGRMVNMIWKTR